MIIDALVISRWSAPLLKDMQAGGLTAANCTCSIWEGFEDTIKNMAAMRALVRQNPGTAIEVLSPSDIDRAKREGKVGVIYGWQNSTGFGDYLPNIPLFHDLGLRIVQLTYNTANSVGDGCYEKRNGGITDFGREVIAALNETGILVDLSHVGSQSAKDAIDISNKPVAYTHCCPSALMPHPRNKSDEELRYIVDRGGFVGVAAVPHFLPSGVGSTVDDFAAAVRHVLNVVGEDAIGMGTDITQDQPAEWYHWITIDKGYARKLVDFSEAPILGGFASLRDYPNIVAALKRAGLPSSVVDKILGLNWRRFLETVWV